MYETKFANNPLELDQNTWYKKISLLPQTLFLFSLDIFNNKLLTIL